MSEEKVAAANWIGPSGLLRVENVEHHLPTMDVGELNALHLELATAADKIKHQLARKEIERQVVGSLDFEGQDWRERARHMLGLKKKQMAAIHAEFARRKSLIPPLEEFAFSAVHEIYGEVGLGRVMSRARTLQDQRRKQISRKGKPASPSIHDRDKVCGSPENPKVRYDDEHQAAAVMDHMEAMGENVAGLSVYGPCPWCGKWHVGHRPDYTRKKRLLARRKAEQAGAQVTQ